MILNFALLGHSYPSVGISLRLVPKAASHTGCHKFLTGPYPRRFLHMTNSAKSPTIEQHPFARCRLVAFFAKYPDFKYDPSKPFMDEFWRLVHTYKFGRHGKKYKLARREIKEAILLQFKDIYGTHKCNEGVWHQFFDAIGIDERPREIGLCYKRAKSIHLNICDLIDRPVTGVDVQKFPNVLELSRYTYEDMSRPRIVPPISKKQDPIVGRLFRTVSNPPKPKAESTPPNASTSAPVTKELKEGALPADT
ncbi:hypothetical protein OPQ81_008991 [Rhizoctonia solani]|nr:hypothetical protein OPQ81_008991 [Rhizoctonia solani]